MVGAPITLNDEQSGLNATQVRRVVTPANVEEVRSAVIAARDDGLGISIAGSRHAMGGQQFGTDTVHLDMRGMRTIRALDTARGIVDVEAGIEWAELIEPLVARQDGSAQQWGIRQKQTGSDRLSLGGALASNVHGRGLVQAPIIEDVESFDLIDAQGELRTVSRETDPRLFSLVIGGYGLFGVVTMVRLRLAPRRILERTVEIVRVDEVADALAARIVDGYLFGDCQYSIDERSDDFLALGILSCYRPAPDAATIPAGQRVLSVQDWQRLLYLTHSDRAAAASAYIDHYLATSGQRYWSDLHQQSEYMGRYHRVLDRFLGASVPGSDIITEIYVPRPALARFMAAAASYLREGAVPVVYGTIRLVERDTESVLAWAREPWACVIFNLHADRTEEGVERAASAFRGLIDLGLGLGGSYYLTYHRFATAAQLEQAHPRFREFLEAKRDVDPDERFVSDWYRHCRDLLGRT